MLFGVVNKMYSYLASFAGSSASSMPPLDSIPSLEADVEQPLERPQLNKDEQNDSENNVKNDEEGNKKESVSIFEDRQHTTVTTGDALQPELDPNEFLPISVMV
jgi:hypothetical protein